MSVEQLHDALAVGCEAADRAAIGGAHLFIGGEMGIGNTTSAAAVACSLESLPAAQLAGPGTGLGADGVAHKAFVIERALGQTTQRSAIDRATAAGRLRDRRLDRGLSALRPVEPARAGGWLHHHRSGIGRGALSPGTGGCNCFPFKCSYLCN